MQSLRNVSDGISQVDNDSNSTLFRPHGHPKSKDEHKLSVVALKGTILLSESFDGFIKGAETSPKSPGRLSLNKSCRVKSGMIILATKCVNYVDDKKLPFKKNFLVYYTIH